jgi:signal peptidase I
MDNIEQKSPEIQNSTENQAPKQSKTKAVVKEIITFILIAVCIVLPFRIYIAEPYLVEGRSMDPTFQSGDYLIVDKLSYRLHEPKRNTVVVFHYPNDPSKSFIKRIIGLPGETVVEKDNEVTIINKENPDGIKIDQSYVVHELPATFKITLKADEYFVMGDNRAESFDSRSWGPLNKKFISGKPILRLLPLSVIGIVPGEDNK